MCESCLDASPSAIPVVAPRAVDWWAAPYAYTGAVRFAIIRLKYRNQRCVVATFVSRMCVVVRPAVRNAAIETVTWIPATPARRHARGFDQSRLIAREVGRQLGLPVRPLLHRANGPPQTGRSRAERRAARLRFVPNGTVPARVLVVDDVATTGTTLTAAARALRAGGATTVGAVTVARTAPGRARTESYRDSSAQGAPPIHRAGQVGQPTSP
jgi:predicted amidophosphoribosyltransferase